MGIISVAICAATIVCTKNALLTVTTMVSDDAVVDVDSNFVVVAAPGRHGGACALEHLVRGGPARPAPQDGRYAGEHQTGVERGRLGWCFHRAFQTRSEPKWDTYK